MLRIFSPRFFPTDFTPFFFDLSGRYGTGAGCTGDGDALVDFGGTQYKPNTTWGYDGAGAWGTGTFYNDGTKVVINGGGWCGWAAPVQAIALYDEEAEICHGGFHLPIQRA